MIRVAFPLIGGKNWTGGYNYLLNLIGVLSSRASRDIAPVLFFPAGTPHDETALFERLPGVKVVLDAAFDESRRSRRLVEALLTGCDRAALKLFRQHRIDAAFEPAQFLGWRFPIPCIAWIPDFQHRFLPHLFRKTAYWKREAGFRAQIAGGRHIMLSSENARAHCERFYPRTKGRTHVVRFAIPSSERMNAPTARQIADRYALPEYFFFLPNQFWKHKNHGIVLEALLVLRDAGRPVVFAVSGRQSDPRDPSYFPAFQARIRELDLENHFRLLGMIPLEHIPALMLSCVALINPSLFEGWSTTVEEAKTLGTPMILSRLDVHVEQVSGQAVFFDPASATELAERLSAFVPLGVAERKTMTDAAAAGADIRVAKFAEDFVAVIESALRRHADHFSN